MELRVEKMELSDRLSIQEIALDALVDTLRAAGIISSTLDTEE